MPLSGWAVMVLWVTRPNRPLNGQLESFFFGRMLTWGLMQFWNFLMNFVATPPGPYHPLKGRRLHYAPIYLRLD
jgi:hypothetical protein